VPWWFNPKTTWCTWCLGGSIPKQLGVLGALVVQIKHKDYQVPLVSCLPSEVRNAQEGLFKFPEKALTQLAFFSLMI
jgi:hypothetical protein